MPFPGSGRQLNISLLMLITALLIFSGLAPADGDLPPEGEANSVEAARLPSTISYNRDVRPILSDKCFLCHGPDPSSRKAKLRLDLQEEALADRDGEAAIVPGDISASLLVERILEEDVDDRMPPASTKKILSDREQRILVRWVEEGSLYEPHWAWKSPKENSPANIGEGSTRSEMVDTLIRERLVEEGLKWQQRATPETLLRRIAFDLTGLPPTLEELDRFLADDQPGAYQRAIDRYLASPAYGEHWGRIWLDAARYGDTHGLHLDNYREMWPYRDWVISAFNRNQPLDQFITWQLAGDLLPEATLEQKVASGFNRAHVTSSEGGAINEEYRMIYSVDRTNTFATVFLGLTAGCAQCHEHKFDPLSQEEYFKLYAFFNNTAEAEMDGNAKAHPPVVKVPTTEEQTKLDAISASLTAATERRDSPDPEMDTAQEKWQQRWLEESSARWLEMDDQEITSTGGATFLEQDDGSYLATGTNPATDTYVIRQRIESGRWQVIRVEGLIDESMPHNGPGRSANGNVVLTEVEAQVKPLDGSGAPLADGQPMRFVEAWADHEQPDFPVDEAIDGKSGGDNGWAIEAFNRHLNSSAYFVAESPFGSTGEVELEIRLRFDSKFANHAFGRVRISLAEGLPTAEEFAWIDDHQNNGGQTQFDGAKKEWPWVEGADHPVHSGSRSRLQKSTDKIIQHYFHQATSKITLSKGDRLYAWVYLDEKDPPKTVMLQFHSGDWNHRAFWGGDRINFGTIGSDTDDHRPMGTRPETGRWVRLEVDPALVGLKAGSVIDGFAFTQFGGSAYWDDAGIVGKSGLIDIEFALTGATADQQGDGEKVRRYFRERHSPGFTALLEEITGLEKEKGTLEGMVATTLVTSELTEKPRMTRLLMRGEYDQPIGETLTPDTPAFLPPFPEDVPRNRIGLAQWLTDADHPLLARVTANRIWQQLFGTGLVITAEDFGSQGSWPSHPQLLDSLAVDLIDNDWDLHSFLKMLMTTETYCQDSAVDSKTLRADPDNRLLTRGPRFRLDAEMVRDQALLLSGLLVDRHGGPSVKPYQPDGLWKAVGYSDSNTVKFVQDHGEALYRRSLYTFWKRTSPPPSLTIFDAPNRETSCVRRERTNTPLQALVLLNDIQYVEAARHLAERIHREVGAEEGDEARLTHLWRMATCRHPDEQELRELSALLEEMRAIYSKDEEAAGKLLTVGESKRGEEIPLAEHAAWTIICNLILNLDEIVTKG